MHPTHIPLAGYRPEMELHGVGLSGYARAPEGWNSGLTRPAAPGLYVRKHVMGASIDFYDGARWRRKDWSGVQCANQFWPWQHRDRVKVQKIGCASHYDWDRKIA